MAIKRLWSVLILLAPFVWGAAFESSIDQKVREVADQLRCPVCRGVPISESPATLAVDMMAQIRKLLVEGKSEEEILAHFEARYGEWILLQPKPKGLNLMVWVLPAALLLGGSGFLLFVIRKWNRRPV